MAFLKLTSWSAVFIFGYALESSKAGAQAAIPREPSRAKSGFLPGARLIP
jgi:hypothetical protein